MLGISDKNIKIIQSAINAQVVVRGSFMHLEGSKEDIKLIELTIGGMMSIINNKGCIETEDIQNYLLSIKEGSHTNLDSNGSDPVILYTHKGSVNARTKGQKKYFEAVKGNDIVFAIGPAGTGKTYQAVAMAVSALKNKSVDKIVITRPAVEAGERLGFLPGDLKEKLDPYMQPIYNALFDMLPISKLNEYLEDGTIQIAPLAFMRGRTLDHAFVILDEGQNTTQHQMKMFLTRMGKSAKFIITGDQTQIDLPAKQSSGLIHAQAILKDIDDISFITLDSKDIIRHKLVKQIIKAYKQ